MKKIRMFLSVIMIFVIILCGLVVLERISFSNDTTPITIVIEEGTSSSGIYNILKKHGLAKTKLGFLINLKLSKYNNKLQYGNFEVNKSMSLTDIFKELATNGAKVETFTLTVPEGYSAEKIAQRLSELNICSEKEFLNALNDEYDYSFLKDIPKKDYKYKLQGFLFPSTYEFFTTVTPHDIISTLLGEFEKQYSAIKHTSKMSMYEIITLASLVEREAKLDSERRIIAGVIKNRLDIDMLLQIDASVVYAISDGLYDTEKVYYRDLENNSLYNTYKYTGLPVGPICNPGIESIKAAINPDNHSYLYYHTDETKQDGSHIFTETYSNHLTTQ